MSHCIQQTEKAHLPVVYSSKIYQSKILCEEDAMYQATDERSFIFIQLHGKQWLEKVEGTLVIQSGTEAGNLHVDERQPETLWRQVFAMLSDVRDRVSRRLLLAYWEKIMNSNDSPKRRQIIYWDSAFTPSLYMCHSRLLSLLMILGWGELIVSHCVLIQH